MSHTVFMGWEGDSFSVLEGLKLKGLKGYFGIWLIAYVLKPKIIFFFEVRSNKDHIFPHYILLTDYYRLCKSCCL